MHEFSCLRSLLTVQYGDKFSSQGTGARPHSGQSIVCTWREFELINKSAEWNVFLEVSNSHRCWTWFTHVRVAMWLNIIQVFYNKKWSCDHFGGFVWWGIYLALWKYDFYGDSLLPIVTREHFVNLFAENNCENGANSPAFHFILKWPRIILKVCTRCNDNLTLR